MKNYKEVLNMKKYVLIFVTFIMAFYCSSCDIDPHEGKRPVDYADSSWECAEYTDACIDDFFEAVEEEDHQAAMELLSTPLIEGQEQKEAISQAFSYVEGAFKSRKRIDSLHSISGMSKYDGEEQFTTYEVKTEEDRYYVAISIYASHGKVKGITSLSIIRADEWDALYPDHPYKGDYKRTPGVHVGALPS